MELQIARKSKFFCLAMMLVMVLGMFVSVGAISNYFRKHWFKVVEVQSRVGATIKMKRSSAVLRHFSGILAKIDDIGSAIAQ